MKPPAGLVLEHGADYLLTVKGNQPTVREQIETLVAGSPRRFSPLTSRRPPRLACRKSTKAARRAAVLSPHQSVLKRSASHWPSEAALLLRQTQGRKDELVALITSVEPSRLDATNRLHLNGDAWGIEGGLQSALGRLPQRRPLPGAQR
jgi:hypothetical protein